MNDALEAQKETGNEEPPRNSRKQMAAVA